MLILPPFILWASNHGPRSDRLLGLPQGLLLTTASRPFGKQAQTAARSFLKAL